MVCAAPRVEPGFWLQITSQRHSPRRAPQAPRGGGAGGPPQPRLGAPLPRAFLQESELWGAENTHVRRSTRGGLARPGGGHGPLTAFLSPFRSGVFSMRASNTSSVSLRTYRRTERRRGGFQCCEGTRAGDT